MAQNLVKKVAKELAGAFYDNEDTFREGRYTRSIRFRDEIKDQKAFINQYWRDFVPVAKKTLGFMLQEPGRSQKEKDQIYDALLDSRGFATDEKLVAPSVLRLN